MDKPREPVAHGIIVLLPRDAKGALPELAKEAASILRALDAPADAPTPADADFVLVLVDADAAPQAARALDAPELKDRAASAIAVAKDAVDGRVAVAHARKQLRVRGAALGARELVFAPEQFGYLGLESDGARERLEILLRSLVIDAEGLRLKREGWEEPTERASE